jgi:hypothetical protein
MRSYERIHNVPYFTVESMHKKVSCRLAVWIRLYSYGISIEITTTSDTSTDDRTILTPHSPCPEFSKFLYFLFAPTLIYRDSYPRTSSVRWNYVLSQFGQFATTSLFGYYLFYRFCLPVFRHFNSEHVTLKIFVLSILNCTLPGALMLFCSTYWTRVLLLMNILFFMSIYVPQVFHCNINRPNTNEAMRRCHMW